MPDEPWPYRYKCEHCGFEFDGMPGREHCARCGRHHKKPPPNKQVLKRLSGLLETLGLLFFLASLGIAFAHYPRLMVELLSLLVRVMR